MNIIELLSRLNGEILANKARALVGGNIVVLARMEGAEWVYTAEGQELANKHSNEVVSEASSKTPRARKAKDVPVEAVAVESAGVEPEL